MIIIGTFVLVLLMYWIYWMLKCYHVDKMTSTIPELPRIPLLGHALLFMGNTRKIFNNIENIASIATENKGVCKIWLGPKLYVAIVNPEDAQIVLENCLEKDAVYKFMRPWLGKGLFVAPLNLWKSHRKILLPVFNNKIIEEYIDVMSEQSDVLVEKLYEKIDQEEFDVLQYVTACTLDIVFETAMGERMEVQHCPDTPYLRARNTVMAILNMRLFKIWLQPDFLFNLTAYAEEQKHNIDLTHKFTDEVIRKRRIEYESNRQGQIIKKPGGKFDTVLDLLFGQEITFTDEQLREHIDSITIAGNDTTALVIAYTLVLLGIHQDSQERVLLEQRAIFGESSRGATKDDLQKMNYLERVIKESMRLYTVVPIIARHVDKDIHLPFSNVTVPKGTGVVVGAYAIHKYELAWGPNPDKYDPDRFLPENSVQRHPAAFLPFSYGARNCIGRNFGMLTMKSIISKVIRSYKIEANDVGALKIEMLLFPVKGHLIKIAKRCA